MTAITCSPGLVKLVKVVEVVAIMLDVLVGGMVLQNNINSIF